MRKVKFRYKDETDFPNEGTFHQWASCYEEFETGPGNYTIGLIELSTGVMTAVMPENIMFLEQEQVLSQKEKNFLLDALRSKFHEAIKMLGQEHLGDIERKILEEQKAYAKELILNLSILQ